MAKIGKAYVSVTDDGGTVHQLAPGTDVPDWAKDKVGDHALEGNEETQTSDAEADFNPDGGNDLNEAANVDLRAGTAPDGTTEAPTGDDGNADADAAKDSDGDTDGEGAPDFTKPAPRSRSKK